MANKAGSIERLTLELSRAFEAFSEFVTPDIVTELGFRLPVTVIEDPALVQAFENLSNRIDELPALSASLSQAIADEDIAQIIESGVQLLEKLKGVFESIQQVASVFSNLANGLPASDQAALLEFADSFPRKLLDYSVVSYLETRSKLAVHGLALIGLLEWSVEQIEAEGSTSPEHTRKEIRFDRLSRILSDPAGLFEEIYGWEAQRSTLRGCFKLSRT